MGVAVHMNRHLTQVSTRRPNSYSGIKPIKYMHTFPRCVLYGPQPVGWLPKGLLRLRDNAHKLIHSTIKRPQYSTTTWNLTNHELKCHHDHSMFHIVPNQSTKQSLIQDTHLGIKGISIVIYVIYHIWLFY